MNRQFYELGIQTTHSAGSHSVKEMVQRAERLGYTGVAITDYVHEPSDLDSITESVEELDTELDVRIGAKLRTDTPEELKDLLRTIREQVDIVVVHGGEVDINRTACGDTRVDVLAHPELMRKDPGLDHVSIKQASQNRVAIQLNVRQLLETRGKIRAHILSHMKQNLRLAQKFDTPVITSSGANTVHYLRAPRELTSFPRILGMDLKDSFATVSDNPNNILVRAERAHDDNTVRPGVRKIDDGDTDE